MGAVDGGSYLAVVNNRISPARITISCVAEYPAVVLNLCFLVFDLLWIKTGSFGVKSG
jgi:hypothetical protein